MDSPAGEVLAPAHTDWLYHHLQVEGGAAEVAAFRAAAAGPGLIPWTEDLGVPAEDWFHLLVAPPAPQRRSLSLDGARILAGQLRDAAEARRQRLLEQAATDRACPLDLHRLLPVPAPLLRHGPGHPEARAWLWTHWGTTQALRGVVVLQPPGRAGQWAGLWRVGFWAADWTPWPALLALRTRWPALRFDVRPLYDGPR
jgi:hypothetical protein